jgi:8-oxo-dGTP diphosphatase
MQGSAKYVYVIAFERGAMGVAKRFLMVRHSRRGWEMPGGRVHREEGESTEEAARREFIEETGHEVELMHAIPHEDGEGMVFIGLVGKKVCEREREEIVEVKFFSELPEENELSFGRSEYEYMLALAKSFIA